MMATKVMSSLRRHADEQRREGDARAEQQRRQQQRRQQQRRQQQTGIAAGIGKACCDNVPEGHPPAPYRS
jgi:hypothetical protein